MGEDEDYFVRGALVARNQNNFEDIAELDEEDKIALREEITHKWKQPFTLHYLVGMSCCKTRHSRNWIKFSRFRRPNMPSINWVRRNDGSGSTFFERTLGQRKNCMSRVRIEK